MVGRAFTTTVNTVSYQQPVAGSNNRNVSVMVVSCVTTGAWKTMVESLVPKVTTKFVSACPLLVSTAALSTELPAGVSTLSSNTISQSKR